MNADPGGLLRSGYSTPFSHCPREDDTPDRDTTIGVAACETASPHSQVLDISYGVPVPCPAERVTGP
jgi:hypothetical protein